MLNVIPRGYPFHTIQNQQECEEVNNYPRESKTCNGDTL